MREIAAPALAREGTPVAKGDRVELSVERPGFSATVSVPSRPAGWVLVAGAPEDHSELERTDYATVRVDAGAGQSWDASLAAAADWLAELPEARGLLLRSPAPAMRDARRRSVPLGRSAPVPAR